MTPTDCLKAGPAELAPIVAEMMPGAELGTELDDSALYMVELDEVCCMKSIFHPWEFLDDAFLVQDRVASLGLQNRFCSFLDSMLNNDPSQMCAYWEGVTASPLNRTRAACAAYLENLESKEPARGN